MANDKKPVKVTTHNEQKLTGFVLGTKKPATIPDKKLAREIAAIKEKGRIVEIPPEFL